MQNYLNGAQNQNILVYKKKKFCSHTFSAHIFIFVCLHCFFLHSCFQILHLLSQMLRLEFYVNQGMFKCHHWSTSYWLRAPPQPISRRGVVTTTLITPFQYPPFWNPPPLEISSPKTSLNGSTCPMVQFLGYILSADGIQKDQGKVHAIRDWPQPQSFKELQWFLWFANF